MNKLDIIRGKISQIGSGEYMDGSSALQGITYHIIPIEGLEDSPRHKVACIPEYEAMRERYVFEGKKVLEIGCANGYHTFKMAREGANIVAYEHDPKVYDVNCLIKDYKPVEFRRVEFINKRYDLTDAQSSERFDLAVMLNVHMWIEKQLGKEDTVHLMRRLARKCKKLFFQTAHAESGGVYKVPYLKDDADVETYLKICNFTDVKEIYRTSQHGGVRIMYEACGLG